MSQIPSWFYHFSESALTGNFAYCYLCLRILHEENLDFDVNIYFLWLEFNKFLFVPSGDKTHTQAEYGEYCFFVVVVVVLFLLTNTLQKESDDMHLSAKDK